MKKKAKLSKKAIIKDLTIAPLTIGQTESLRVLSNMHASNILKAVDIFKPYRESIQLMQKRNAELMRPAIALASFYDSYFESIRQLQAQILAPTLMLSKTLNQLFESTNVFRSLALAENSIAKQMQGMVITLPFQGYSTEISAGINVELSLTRLKKIDSITNEYQLDGVSTETIQHDRIGLRISSGFEMRVAAIESHVVETNHKLDYMTSLLKEVVDENRRKDDLLYEVTDYIKTTGSPLSEVRRVGYNHATTEIMIDDMFIKVRSNTNQSAICKVLLSSKTSMRKTWEMEDIVMAMNEMNEARDWHRIIYDAVRELNIKILMGTGSTVQDFFILNMKTVTVNPKYRP